MKSIGAEFLRLDALPGVNHMRGMQYKIVLNIFVMLNMVHLYDYWHRYTG